MIKAVKAILIRYDHSSKKQTLGELLVYNEEGERFSCKTLELPDNDNIRFESRIPEGNYEVKCRWSSSYGRHLHVLNVVDRDWILIHAGNYHHQTEGCILVGNDFYDLNNDGEMDVTRSQKTLTKLLEFCGEEFTLEIIDL